MRSIFSLVALFSLGTLLAGEYVPTRGREMPRGIVVAGPTAQEAARVDSADNRYFTRLAEWKRNGNTFTTEFTVPFAWVNRQMLFRLASASADYEVRVNGKAAACNADPNAPAEFNLTRLVKEGRNTLEIVLASPSAVAALESWKESPEPRLGGAWLLSQPTMRVRDVLVKTWYGDPADTAAMAEVGLVVKSDALNPRSARVYYELLTPAGERAAAGHSDLKLDMRREDTVRFLARIPDSLLWSAERPTRYTLRVKTQHEGRYTEYLEFRPGFRVVEANEGKLSVNGRPVRLRVREVPATLSAEEIARLREQGYNTLRPLPGIVPDGFYELCDRQGMFVIAQAPIDTRRSGTSRRRGGNPSNDPAWLGAYLERTGNSYHTSKSHPSVIAFSLARQSANGINLYESYLEMKRRGDTRPVIYPDAGGEWNSDKLTLE